MPSTAMTSLLAAAAFVLPALVKAGGDWPCVNTAACEQFGETGDISNNSTCVADPMNPEYGYCGFVGAPCSSDFDCDYGKCNNGQCRGYMGDSCSTQLDCMGYFGCSDDGICGGTGTNCKFNGAEDCFSNVCTDNLCAAAPAAGMPVNSGCSVDSNCAGSDMTCDQESFLCARVAAVNPAPGASQGARMKTKRNGQMSGGAANPKDRRGKIHAWFKNHQFCPLGQTACGTATGFECIDTLRNIESCGGCPPIYASNTTGTVTGTDCSTLPGVDEVMCSSGHCTILSCLPGSMLSEDSKSCIIR